MFKIVGAFGFLFFVGLVLAGLAITVVVVPSRSSDVRAVTTRAVIAPTPALSPYAASLREVGLLIESSAILPVLYRVGDGTADWGGGDAAALAAQAERFERASRLLDALVASGVVPKTQGIIMASRAGNCARALRDGVGSRRAGFLPALTQNYRELSDMWAAEWEGVQ